VDAFTGAIRRPPPRVVRVVALLSAVLAAALMLTGVVGVGTARAQTADVSVTPATATTPNGQSVTYTMSVTCSVSGGCNGTTVTFPSTAITGDGPGADFGSWVSGSSCPTVTESASGGVVTFTYGNIPTGTSQCTFTVTPPYLTTANGTVATITPTISGSNFPSSTGPAARLTVTASSSGTTFNKQANVGSTGPGGAFAFTVYITCPSPGGVATSAATITDPLPANFTYASATSTSGTVSYDAATSTVTVTASGNVCLGGSHRLGLTIFGTAATAGVPDAPGTSIVNTASSSVTFIDGTSMTPTASLTVPVVNLVPTPFLSKGGAMADFSDDNKGQYTFNGTPYPYTFPGNWTGSGTPASYTISLATTRTAAGVGFTVRDPLPCLGNSSASPSGPVYTSNAPGTTCASPAFIPTVVTASGFTPAASDEIS
jgi:hypothetical protein